MFLDDLNYYTICLSVPSIVVAHAAISSIPLHVSDRKKSSLNHTPKAALIEANFSYTPDISDISFICGEEGLLFPKMKRDIFRACIGFGTFGTIFPSFEGYHIERTLFGVSGSVCTVALDRSREAIVAQGVTFDFMSERRKRCGSTVIPI